MNSSIENFPAPEQDKKNLLGIVLKVIAAAVAALLGALGIQSCVFTA